MPVKIEDDEKTNKINPEQIMNDFNKSNMTFKQRIQMEYENL